MKRNISATRVKRRSTSFPLPPHPDDPWLLAHREPIRRLARMLTRPFIDDPAAVLAVAERAALDPLAARFRYWSDRLDPMHEQFIIHAVRDWQAD